MSKMGIQNLPRIEKFDYSKHLPQSSADKTSDVFFVLFSLYIAEREQKELTQLVLEKALFKTEQELATENISFLNTFFYINKLGPHNNVFYKYLDELEGADLIDKEGRKISLTAKGLNTCVDLLESIPKNSDILDVLIKLQNKIKYCSSNIRRSVDETHAQKVIDTTDKNETKTIDQLIAEIKPENLFERGSQFKYINPFSSSNPQKVSPPPDVIHKLENIRAKVDEIDFQQNTSFENLFT